MDIKDKAVKFYIERYVIPKALILDKPGFVDFKISGKTEVFARQILVPESFFINLERKIISGRGDAGRKIMYSLGKRFGYRFAQLGRFENITDHPGEKVVKWVDIASKFVGGTYATDVSQTTDVTTKTVDYTLRNFVICEKLEYDYFLATGGAAGVVAWILQDPTIEGKLYNSKFDSNGDHVCNVKCAPYDVLSQSFESDFFKETNVDDLKPDLREYRAFNAEVNIKYKKSFQSYLDAGLFKYKRGIIKYKEERFFLMEVSAIYLLEMLFSKDKDLLFNTAFYVGNNLFGEMERNSLETVLELLSALGWGEVLDFSTRTKKRIVINHFPWTKWYKEIEFSMVAGLLSGIFSKISKKETVFRKTGLELSNGHLTLIFDE